MSIAQAPLPLERSVQEARADQRAGVTLVDLRAASERRAGMPAGAVVMTAQDVRARYAREPDWRANLLCGGGARSLVLAATLRRQGLGPAFSVAGGFERWREAGLPVERDGARAADAPGESRYARHLVMPQVGAEGQARLRRARVLLAGLGGLNSPAALYLAAAGVGTLGLLDHDSVERSNLQRQVLFGEGQLGEPKARSAQARIRDLNPEVDAVTLEQRLDDRNAPELIDGWDAVVDGTDNFPVRYALNQACVASGTPLVYGAVMRFQGQVSVFWPAHAGGDAPCLHCLLPRETTVQSPPSCAEAGVLGVLPGVIGTLQATETLKLLLGIGEPLVGRLLMVDALAMDFRKTRIRPNPDCPVCRRG
jgi:molybdopterin/thiamine biosynthesis adenylyltransferase/rhodanese-related sulfurtransferase